MKNIYKIFYRRKIIMAKHKTKVNKNKVRFANEETKELLNQLDKTYFQDRMLSELDTAVKDAFRNDQICAEYNSFLKKPRLVWHHPLGFNGESFLAKDLFSFDIFLEMDNYDAKLVLAFPNHENMDNIAFNEAVYNLYQEEIHARIQTLVSDSKKKIKELRPFVDTHYLDKELQNFLKNEEALYFNGEMFFTDPSSFFIGDFDIKYEDPCLYLDTGFAKFSWDGKELRLLNSEMKTFIEANKLPQFKHIKKVLEAYARANNLTMHINQFIFIDKFDVSMKLYFVKKSWPMETDFAWLGVGPYVELEPSISMETSEEKLDIWIDKVMEEMNESMKRFDKKVEKINRKKQ